MREILFRGKRIDNGEWVEGALIVADDIFAYICPDMTDVSYGDNGNRMRIGCWYQVDPATVGQYTGLTDKNGQRIFEGGIVKTQPFSDRPYSKRAKFKQHIGVVEHKILPKYVSEWSVKIDDYDGFGCCSWSAFYDCEVIGNIHDNPELLEGGQST